MNWKDRLTTIRIGDKVKILKQHHSSPYGGYNSVVGKIYIISAINKESKTGSYITEENVMSIRFRREELQRI